jgi:hypothetical protein
VGVLHLEQRLCLARARLRSGNGFRNFRNCREKRFDGIFAPIHFKRGARGSPPMRSSQTSRRARPALNPRATARARSGGSTVSARDPGLPARTQPRRPLVG